MTPDDATGRLHPLRHPRARDGRGRERHGASSGLLPCVGTFFVFSDYMRPGGAARRAHADEGRASCGRTTRSASARTARRTSRSSSSRRCARCPGLRVIRPADANEVAAAWQVHLDGDGPTALAAHPPEGPGARRHRRARRPPGVPAGAYVLVDENRDRADLVLIGTGSEVQVCVAAPRAARAPQGSRPGSCRCRRGTCSKQQAARLPAWRCCRPGVPTLAVEAGVRFGWERYADDVVSIDRFGASAPGEVVMRELGITPEHVVERALALLDAVGAGGR